MLVGPMKPDGRAPIVDHEHDVFRDANGLQPYLDVRVVIDESIGAAVRRPGVAHPDEVWCQAASVAGDRRDHVAPQMGVGGVPMKEDYGATLTGFCIGDGRAEDLDLATLIDVVGRNGHRFAS